MFAQSVADHAIREARHLNSISQIASQFPVWKQERLPPPRVSQSQYDKIGLTSKLDELFR